MLRESSKFSSLGIGGKVFVFIIHKRLEIVLCCHGMYSSSTGLNYLHIGGQDNQKSLRNFGNVKFSTN